MKLIQLINKIISRFCVFLLIVLCVVGIAQVFFRYALNNSLSWSEEFLRYSFVWITFLGAALAVKEKIHVRIDLVSTKLGEKARRYYQLVTDLFISVFLFILFIQGIQISIRAFVNDLTSTAMELPLEVIYIIVAVGAIAMLINQIYVMIQDFKDMDSKSPGIVKE